ncbi:hypothetical protein F5148DRAFT_126833 [Russula earlei]|uniref:Uncharacterized protein n=1 Tax=Russula earlei TaxID=71964 RepID=A0ACC0UMM8_9AGAM|nr:hypothetical protein F5148DRAFT_126833 [Russula earlei]
MPPRKVEETAALRGRDDDSEDGDDPQRREREQNKEMKRVEAQDRARERTRRWLLVRVGAGVVLVDSFVRWSRLQSGLSSSLMTTGNDREAAVAFLRIMLGCFVETASFHGGITLASILVLTGHDRVARRKHANSPLSTIRQQLRYSHISLCLFYSSLTKFLLLVVLSIWEPQVHRRDVPNNHQREYAYKMSLESPFWHFLDDDILDRTWLVRNMLGGMSTGFGLRVVLDCHPFFTSLVILSGCLIKTVVVGLVREFVGPGNDVDETWLAYSIP